MLLAPPTREVDGDGHEGGQGHGGPAAMATCMPRTAMFLALPPTLVVAADACPATSISG
jgi:hypothetical protein